MRGRFVDGVLALGVGWNKNAAAGRGFFPMGRARGRTRQRARAPALPGTLWFLIDDLAAPPTHTAGPGGAATKLHGRTTHALQAAGARFLGNLSAYAKSITLFLTQPVFRVTLAMMKTISLTESAYQRLRSWKEGGTFSEVVERMVPAKGTIASALAAAESLPEMPDKAFDALEKSVNATRATLPPGWT
jgi:predicted CopG family antitoxin